jgi:hypothetical protein
MAPPAAPPRALSCAPMLRLAPVLLLLLLAAACGGAGATGETAATVVTDDWNFNSDFTGRARVLRGSSADVVRCPDPVRGVSRCTVLATLEGGGRRSVRVIVRFDDNGQVARWDIGRVV